MKTIRLFLLLLMTTLIVACEKSITEEEVEKPRTETDGNTPQDNNHTGDEQGDTDIEALTVAEAQLVENGTSIWVKGYIVASTTRSIKNVDFEAPFTGSTAIVLADKPADADDFDYDEVSLLYPICLTDSKSIRAELNLEDNPELWNHLIYIYGIKDKYMSMPGMRKVKGYEITW